MVISSYIQVMSIIYPKIPPTYFQNISTIYPRYIQNILIIRTCIPSGKTNITMEHGH